MMKAILYTDMLNLKQSIKAMGMMLLFFGVMGFVFQEISFFVMLLVMLSVMLPFNLFAYESSAGWDKLMLSLPVTRSDVIASKYLICCGQSTLLAACLCGVGAVYAMSSADISWIDLTATVFFCLALSWVVNGVMFPLIVRYGVTKARYLLLIVVWTPILLFWIAKQAVMQNPFVDVLIQISETNLWLLGLSALAGAAAIMWISMRISIALYQKKEF